MPALDHLAGLFYADMAELGTFEEVLAEQTPEPYRTLLAHHEHMTVAVEQHHGSPVDVEVLATQPRRRLLLPQDRPAPAVGRGVVLFGIPRLNLRLVDDDVRREILERAQAAGPRADRPQRAPRGAARLALSRRRPGPTCCRLLGLAEPRTTYGRTAFIYLRWLSGGRAAGDCSPPA